MKNPIILLFILGAWCIMSFNSLHNHSDNLTKTTTFWVAGVCGRCESTIEKALDVKGVVSADYNLDTQLLTVVYKPAKITEDQMHKLLNEVGYDTEKSTCTQEQYERTHGCCKYRELEKH
jgi:periplasmic mercuric ion binding protein